MSKYPLDEQGSTEHFAHLLNHDKGQRDLISDLKDALSDALRETDDEDMDWQENANRLLKRIEGAKIAHETNRFNENNVKRARGMKVETVVNPDIPKIMQNLGDIETEQELNRTEGSFGQPLTEEFLERFFNEREIKGKKAKKVKEKPVEKMTLEEIEEWEKKQENSNDIYKVKARVANLARGGGAALTQVGEMMVNTYVHVLMDLYKFADGLTDKDTKIALTDIIRKHENMPGNLIAATKSGVKIEKDEK